MEKFVLLQKEVSCSDQQLKAFSSNSVKSGKCSSLSLSDLAMIIFISMQIAVYVPTIAVADTQS